MNKILILFAHPLYERSRIHKSLVNAIPPSDQITFRDLYELYPDFNINIEVEQELLSQHNIIIFQHPLYWYSIPPLLKQWIDMVLQFGWAYGKGGEVLKDKIAFNVLSSGGQEQVYSAEGRNRYTIKQFLAPIEQTMKLCHMQYWPPFVVHGTHMLQPDQIKKAGDDYRKLLLLLFENVMPNSEKLSEIKYLNELVNSFQQN
jgi:glutathione-regulated potassium-efflux system ancillary protein KefG